ncbi:MAG: hypothetical protein KC620_22175, partial [Myxococcales bacterium]|nr:hypothetical protein [Myxococcales bacterium]
MCRAVCSLALLWVLSGCSGAEVETGAEDLGFGGADEFSGRDLGRHDAEAPDEDQGPRPDHGAPGCMITSPIDEPDPQGIDQNCDGIDGDRALAVFVAPGGDDRAAGDQEHPVATVARAFEIAADRRANQVLLAAGDWQVEQTIALADGIGLYGGYAPADGWRRSGEASVLRGPALAMVARGLTRPTTLARLTVRADDNSAPGGASVALLAVETVELLLTDGARLEAGVGGDGPSGRDGSAG